VVVSNNAGKSKIPAGWYPDPDDETLNRWWDGLAWTDHRSALAEVTAQADAAAERLANAANDLEDAKDAAVDEFRAAATKLTNDSRSLVGSSSTGSTSSASSIGRTPSLIGSVSSSSTGTGSSGYGTTSFSSTSAARTTATAPRVSSSSHNFAASRSTHRVPEITQPKNTFGKTLAAFSFITIVVGLGIIVGVLIT
jgi:hypothetical protein